MSRNCSDERRAQEHELKALPSRRTLMKLVNRRLVNRVANVDYHSEYDIILLLLRDGDIEDART